MASLLLATDTWDLVLDANLNIAICQEPYADAQDAACQLRLFQGELRYDTTQGMPYWQQILGHWPAPSVFKAYMAAQALLATGVVSATPVITAWSDREVRGAVLVTNDRGQTSAASFASGFTLSKAATTI